MAPPSKNTDFPSFEGRETHALEVCLTRIGKDPDDFWGANAHKYTLKLNHPRSK